MIEESKLSPKPKEHTMSRRTNQLDDGPDRNSRRGMLRQTAGAAVLGMTALGTRLNAQGPPSSERAVKNGRIPQSIVYWCFEKYWDMDQACKVANQFGCDSIELIAPKFFPVLKQHGLKCAIGTIDMSPDPPFVKGFNNPKYREQVLKATREAIDACADFGFKEIVGHAEKKGVTLCLEMLNSRVSSHPMKGHPGYQGDHTDYCIDIIKRVGSPSLKLLFDIYHVQIMDGDIISRLRQHRDYIGHVHTAGNPGRAELDDKQEISYRPIMETLIEIGYKGHVGQEFIPTRDPVEGLRQAVTLCDV